MNNKDYNLYHLFQKNAQSMGDNPAFITAKETVSYSQFLESVDRLAAGFSTRGIEKGDRVCVLAQNSIAYMELIGACAKTGAIAFPINWRLSASEVQGVIALADPKLLVVDQEYLPKLEETDLSSVPTKVLIGEGETPDFDPITDLYVSEIGQAAEVGNNDPLAIISTAAVAGVPRGAILTHENFGALGDQFIASFKLTPQDRFLALLPFFHIAGLNWVAGAAQAGGASVIMDSFDPAMGAKLIDEHQVTLIGTFPPMLEMLLGAREQIGASWDSLRYCFGILNPPEVIQKFITEVGAEYWTGYGQAETTGIVTLINVVEKPGSAGKAVPLLQMRCVDEEGKDVPIGEPGEIAVQGSLVFAGYWRDEDATKYTSRFGWHHTGDVGKLDQDGYLYFVGRKPEKELIKSGGENIYPAEVEHVIRSFPEVAEVCVIGVPDEKWGEAVIAVVELASGKSLSEEDLIKAVVEQIASYKKPQHVQFVEQLPRLESGEVDREAVKGAHG
jgi:acyl-CoA synthetase (AMP-forming)/AMP-acid ligase II